MAIDYMIEVAPLVKPIGNVYHFVAKLAYCYESSNGSERSIDPGVREALGRTKDEARDKLDAKMRTWIQAREQLPKA